MSNSQPKQLLFIELTILFIVTCFASIGLFLRTNLFAYDSYAFLSYARGFTGEFGYYHELIYTLLKILPVNVLIYDFLMFGCLFIALFGLYYGLKVVYGKRIGMLSVLVTIACSPLMVFSFAQFQNEVFAYPFIFLSFMFLMQKRFWLSCLFALGCCFFWLGGVVWIGVVAAGLVVPFLLVLVVSSPLWYDKLIWAFGFAENTSYNTFLWGLFDLFLLFPFIFVVFKQDNKRWWVWLGVALLFTCFSARYSILCLPFIALGIAYSVDKYLLKWFSLKLVLLLCVLLIFGWNIALFMQHPTINEIDLVKIFVKDCKNNICVNDWSLGWWVTSEGGVTTFKGGLPNPSYSSLEKPFLALTSLSLDCNLVQTQGIVNYYSC